MISVTSKKITSSNNIPPSLRRLIHALMVECAGANLIREGESHSSKYILMKDLNLATFFDHTTNSYCATGWDNGRNSLLLGGWSHCCCGRSGVSTTHEPYIVSQCARGRWFSVSKFMSIPHEQAPCCWSILWCLGKWWTAIMLTVRIFMAVPIHINNWYRQGYEICLSSNKWRVGWSGTSHGPHQMSISWITGPFGCGALTKGFATWRWVTPPSTRLLE